MNGLSAAVLAGGQSTRMGRDKAFVELNRRPLIVRVTDRLWSCADEVFVVTKHPEDFDRWDLCAVPDGIDAQTPLAGVLGALRATKHERVFICACDTPFIAPDVVRLLAARLEGCDAAVPRRNDRPEPLHVVWSARAVDRVADAIEAGERAVHRVLEGLRVASVEEDEWRPLDPRGRSFVNINSPAELDEAERTAGRSRRS